MKGLTYHAVLRTPAGTFIRAAPARETFADAKRDIHRLEVWRGRKATDVIAVERLDGKPLGPEER